MWTGTAAGLDRRIGCGSFFLDALFRFQIKMLHLAGRHGRADKIIYDKLPQLRFYGGRFEKWHVDRNCSRVRQAGSHSGG